MAGTDGPEVEAGAASRVIFFSDAVVAIAITLLALGLPLPDSTGSTTNSQLLRALVGYWDEYLAFVISFVVIGGHWVRHRRIFRYVSRVNHRIGQLTLLWLLMMVLTPFAARLLAGSGGFGVRFTLYVVIQVIASGCLVLMSRAVVRGGLLQPDAPEAARHPDNVSSLTIIVMFVLSVPVAFFTAWAFALWAAVPFLTRALRWRMARTAPPAAAHAEQAARGTLGTARLKGRFRVRSREARWW
ncbi:MAG TPA: TMEM175 family protein [Trebonia sp.]